MGLTIIISVWMKIEMCGRYRYCGGIRGKDGYGLGGCELSCQNIQTE